MSDAGYILDKTPDNRYISKFDGSYIPITDPAPDYDSSAWYMNSGSDVNYSNSLSSEWFVIEYKHNTYSANFLSSPYLRRDDKSANDIHATFTTKLLWYAVDQDSLFFTISGVSTTVGSITIKPAGGSSSDGIEVFDSVGASLGTYVIDILDEIRWDVYLSGAIYTIYANGEKIMEVDGSYSGGSGIAQLSCGFIDCDETSDKSDLYIKNCSIEFNTSFRDGYNLLRSDNSITTSNEAGSSFPISNLYNGIANKPCLFTSNEIKIEMLGDGGTIDPKYRFSSFAILGHNFTPQAIIKLSYGGTSYVEESIYLEWKDEEIIWDNAGVVLTKARVILEVIDPLNPNDISIGELILGTPTYFSQCFFWGCSFNTEYNNIIHYTDFKNKWTYHLNRIKAVKDMNFSMIDDDTVEELFALFEEADGSRYPVLFFWDTRNEDLGIIYGTLQDKFKNKLSFIEVNEVTKLEIIGLPYAKIIEDDN